jgi:hypothetical protein
MEDYKLLKRKDNYRKCNKISNFLGKFTIMESRERYNLTLRKQTIEDFIFKKRIKYNQDTESTSNLEINPNDLNIDSSYKNYLIKDLVRTKITYNNFS